MNLEYYKQRFWELYNYATALRQEADRDALEGKEILDALKEAETEEDKTTLLKEFKKNQFFTNLKLSEMEKTLHVAVELVSMSKVMGIDLELTPEIEELYELGKPRFVPLYSLKGGELIFLNKEMEKAVEDELNRPSENDLEAVRKILRANRKWQRKN